MQPKRLDDAMLGQADIVNAPEPDEALPQAVASTALQPVQPMQNVFDDEAARRHGRIAAKSFGIGYKRLVKEELDGDIRDTFGDAMGEIFGVFSRTGSRPIYWLVLGGSLLPLVAVMVVSALNAAKDGEEKDA